MSLDTSGKCSGKRHHAHDLSAQGERHGYGYAAGLADLQADLFESPRDVDQRHCEPNLALVPARPAEFDFSVGDAGVTLEERRDTAAGHAFGAGLYQVSLASWDWGGTVHIDVADNVDKHLASADGRGSLNLPVNSVPETTAKTVLDGLTNFEKYRGVYLVAPPRGPRARSRASVRLDPSMRTSLRAAEASSPTRPCRPGSAGYKASPARRCRPISRPCCRVRSSSSATPSPRSASRSGM